MEEFSKVRWNLNASFKANLGEDRLKREVFDLINSRFLTDGIHKDRWASLVMEYKQLLKPHGWLQMAEVSWTFHSQSGQALPNLTAWSEAYSRALCLMDRDPQITGRMEQVLAFAGFELVNRGIRRILVGTGRGGDHRIHVVCESAMLTSL